MTITDPDDATLVVPLDMPGVSREAVLDLACPLFADAKRAHQREYGFACSLGAPPAGERITRLSPTGVLFVDPPGVAGTGVGSGSDPSATGAPIVPFRSR